MFDNISQSNDRENKLVDQKGAREKREDFRLLLAPILGALIIFVVLGIGVYLVTIDKDVWGFSVLLVALAVLILAIVYGKGTNIKFGNNVELSSRSDD